MADKNGGGRPPKARNMNGSSDSADARWSVRGVPKNIRQTAVKMAESRAMTTGDWLSEAIHFYAKADKNGVSADTETAVRRNPSAETSVDVRRIVEECLPLLQESMTANMVEMFRQTQKVRNPWWLWWKKAA